MIKSTSLSFYSKFINKSTGNEWESLPPEIEKLLSTNEDDSSIFRGIVERLEPGEYRIAVSIEKLK